MPFLTVRDSEAAGHLELTWPVAPTTMPAFMGSPTEAAAPRGGEMYPMGVYTSECLNQDGACALLRDVWRMCARWGKGGRGASAGLSSRP